MTIGRLLRKPFLVNGRINSYANRIIANVASPKHRTLVSEAAKIDSIEDIEPLRELRRKCVKDGSFKSYDANFSNACIYGIWNSLFGEIDAPIYELPAVEHGLIFSDQVCMDLYATVRPCVVTFGDFRKERIQKQLNIPVFNIGPYIAYADPYYQGDVYRKLKRKLGRTLTVFPCHSTDISEIDFDLEKYVHEIIRIASDFDSVLVNSFWWNVDDPLIHRLESEGCRIVSAGYRDDVLFLSRLRTIIELSDLVVGDSIGTHVGYAFELGVPFRLITAKPQVSINSSSEDANYFSEVQNNHSSIAKLLLREPYDIENLKRLTDQYWGFSYVMSKNRIKEIARISLDIANSSRHKPSRYLPSSKILVAKYEIDKEFTKKELLQNAINGVL